MISNTHLAIPRSLTILATMSNKQERSGFEPQISAANGRRTFVVDANHLPRQLTGLEPELGGSRRVATDPHIVALLLSSDSIPQREYAIQHIQSEGQAALYTHQLAAIIPPNARRRIAGLWNMHYRKRHRLNAIMAVGALRESNLAIKPLFAALGDSDKTIRRTAIKALAALWNMRDLRQLAHERPRRRIAAASSLATRADPRTIAPLLVSIHDEDALVRVAIASALGTLAAHHAIEDLLQLLRDTDWLVRQAAVEALGQIAANLAPGDARLQDMLTPLTTVLQRGTLSERQAAVEALSRIADPDSVLEPLLNALEDRDQTVQAAAITALGNLGDPRAFEPLAAMLASNPSAQRTAISALAQLSDPRAIPLLLDALQHKSSHRMRLDAAQALTAFDDPNVVDLLAELLNADEPTRHMRWAAALALRQIGTERALAILAQHETT